MSNIALNFFIELWHRLKTKSPTFFRVLQAFAAALTFAGYLPSMLQRWFNVEVPGHTIALCEDIAKYAIGFLAAASLPVKSPQVSVNEEGKILNKTDEKKLPFTAKKEIKQAEKPGGVLAPQTELMPEVVATKEEAKIEEKKEKEDKP